MTNDALLKFIRRAFFYIFVVYEKLYDMDTFLSATIILSSLFIVAYLYVRHIKGKDEIDQRVKFTAILFTCEALLVACDLIAGGEVVRRLPMDLNICIIGLSTVTSSLWDDDWIKSISDAIIAVLLFLALYAVLSAIGAVPIIPDVWVMRIIILTTILLVLLQCLSFWLRIRDIRALMKSGTVWQNLSLSVDCIYIMMITVHMMIYVLLDNIFPYALWYSFVISSILAAVTFAFGIRVINDSLFVLLVRHEETILESMKISHVEVVNDSMKEDDTYREIYERVTEYFDHSQPFLNSELTISDVGKEVFSNKLYISKAISQYTGRNFCQFVNYYRITYSLGLFRRNPDMNITELANASGFNTVASFGMAFKLFMNENPSDWCRRERTLIIKGKK